MEVAEETFNSLWRKADGGAGGSLLAGKPKPTSCPLCPPLFLCPSSPQSRGTPDVSSGAGLHHLQARSGRKDSARRSSPGNPLVHRVHGAFGAVLPLMPREMGGRWPWGVWLPEWGGAPRAPRALGSGGSQGFPSCKSAPRGPEPRAWKCRENPRVCEWALR